MERDRRQFLASSLALGASGLLIAAPIARAEDPRANAADTPSREADKQDQPAEEVPATEDLMREHGVLNRVLLIYEEGLRRLRDKEDVTPDAFHKPALLVRKFVED